MSFSVLSLATVQTLRSSIPALRHNNCDVTVDARPPAWSASPMFVAVYGSGWMSTEEQDPHEVVMDDYQVTIAVNARTSSIPRDRWGPEMIASQMRGIEAFAKRIQLVMYSDRYLIMELANQILQGPYLKKPLLFAGMARTPTPLPAKWFHAQEEEPFLGAQRRRREVPIQAQEEPLEHHGLLLEMNYIGGKRMDIPTFVTQFVKVTLIATRQTTPALTGFYGDRSGDPSKIEVSIADQSGTVIDGPYQATFSAGSWLVPTIASKSPGTYDIIATATYENPNQVGDIEVSDDTKDELIIFDTQDDWLWSDSSNALWSDGDNALWTPGA